MAKLITQGNKLQTRANRLVTDVGGAPCCCGDGCVCSDILASGPFRFQTCMNGVIGSALTQPYKLAKVRVQWASGWTVDVKDTVPGYVRVAQATSSGTALFCVRSRERMDATLTQASAGYSFRSYQRAFANPNWVEQSHSVDENYAGFDALVCPEPFGATDPNEPQRRFRLALTYQFDILFTLGIGFRASYAGHVNDEVSPSLPGNFAACSDNQTVTRQTSSGRTTTTHSQQFSGGAGGGTFTEYALYDATFNASRERYEGRASAQWSVQYDDCSGGNNPAGGCTDCGDPTTLTIIA